MSDRSRVSAPTTLLPHLLESLEGWSRSRVKQRLTSGRVTVNGEVVTQYDHPLAVGDDIEVLAKPPKPRSTGGLIVLFDDLDLIAVHKPAGLLSVATDKGDDYNALHIVREQFSTPRQTIDIWPVHRIDRDTSGVLLFATTLDARKAVTGSWEGAEKTYLAAVEGIPDPASGTIELPLRMDKKGFRAIVGHHPDALSAVTHYTTMKAGDGRAMLEVRLGTGRQHQIRAHMAAVGHPLVGDDRYGTKGRRLGLHALRLTIPAVGGRPSLTFESPPAADFLSLVR